MDTHNAGLAGLGADRGFDRYAQMPQGLARVVLGLLAVFLLLAAIAPGYSPPPPPPPKVSQSDASGHKVVKEDDNDLRLYRLIDQRIARGDDYYVAATEEQRNNNYPVAPGLTVRLPTLAMVTVAVGPAGLVGLQVLLFVAMMLANARRLGLEPGGESRRPMALALLMAGIASGLSARYNMLHEIWAAQLIALSFGLHRPQHGRWGAAWLAAAAALAVRELSLPFVLLMAAWALWHRRWREGAAWVALIVLFGIALASHLHFAEAQIRPGDPVSPSWVILKGISGLMYKVNNSTFLSLVPVPLSGMFVVLALFGWTGWRSPMGSFGALLTLGYAFAFSIAGRDNNFYWGILITPLLFMGAAFLPFALPSLWRAAGLDRGREPALA
ncbi:MAG TPA: hypothetical protein VFP14_05940 [Novosphingobium sp.]|nr:hypothetical protein [Novosphingobium sp.]